MRKKACFTTNQGAPVYDDQTSLTAGKSGPILLQDTYLIDKIAHFTRERIPERVLHAKGAGAYGCFKAYQSMSRFTKADFLCEAGRETPVFVRFSLATGSKGGADTVRDIRGFSVKFYTEQGNYDLIGNHIPVFPIVDPMQFPDLVHALKANPISNIQGGKTGNSRLWDFMSLHPESLHFLLYLFSEAGIVKSYRRMRGYSVNTYKWVNCDGEASYVRYQWEPMDGVCYLDSRRAEQLAGSDPDAASRDLFNAIEAQKEIRYELYAQLIRVEESCNWNFDPLDPTKVWPHNLAEPIPVGGMALTENPRDYFSEVEQAAFSPAAVVPGIEFSNDRILQGRLFAYSDAQRYRVGVNYLELPVNQPKTCVDNHTQDGAMQYRSSARLANYDPNSLCGGMPKLCAEPGTPYIAVVRGSVEREKPAIDNYTHANQFYCAMTELEQKTLITNLAGSLRFANPPVRERAVKLFCKVNGDLGKQLYAKLNED